MRLTAICDALRRRLREMISDGLTSETKIAECVGVSQAHISNVLKSQRGMSFNLADALLDFAQLGVEDLIPEEELSAKRPFVGGTLGHFIAVPIVSQLDASSVHVQQRHTKGTLLIPDHLAPESVAANGRAHWDRFIAVKRCHGEIVVIDRHIYAGAGQFALKSGDAILSGRLFPDGDRVYFLPDSPTDPLRRADHVIGKIVQYQRTVLE